jgi:hypothetical protein
MIRFAVMFGRNVTVSRLRIPQRDPAAFTLWLKPLAISCC